MELLVLEHRLNDAAWYFNCALEVARSTTAADGGPVLFSKVGSVVQFLHTALFRETKARFRRAHAGQLRDAEMAKLLFEHLPNDKTPEAVRDCVVAPGVFSGDRNLQRLIRSYCHLCLGVEPEQLGGWWQQFVHFDAHRHAIAHAFDSLDAKYDGDVLVWRHSTFGGAPLRFEVTTASAAITLYVNVLGDLDMNEPRPRRQWTAAENLDWIDLLGAKDAAVQDALQQVQCRADALFAAPGPRDLFRVRRMRADEARREQRRRGKTAAT